jgi:hypothetical protein
LALHLPSDWTFRHSGKECQMRSDLTDETHGQDAHPQDTDRAPLRDLIRDAMRRTDAAAIASPNAEPGVVARAPFALPGRSLRWEAGHGDLFARLTDRCTDLATIAAALHRGRVASSLRSSATAAALDGLARREVNR